MTLEQVEQSLPNGLHDAQIQQLRIDYERAEIVLRLRVLIGLPDEPPPDRHQYATADLTFRGLQLFATEFPHPESAFRHPGAVWFSYERTPPGTFPPPLAQKLAPELQSYSLFIREWLSHIHIAARDISFAWITS